VDKIASYASRRTAKFEKATAHVEPHMSGWKSSRAGQVGLMSRSADGMANTKVSITAVETIILVVRD
jgi:hypothetical protein